MDDLKSIHALAYFNFLKTGSWVEENVKQAIKDYGLTHAQLNVLYILINSENRAVSSTELKEQILVNNPDISRLLDRLVKKGFISRKTCPKNRRKIDITITEEGKKIFRLAHLAAKESVGHFFKEKITLEEAQELRRILQKIRK